MPLPDARRTAEYSTKAFEVLARFVGEAPEQRQARRLVARAPERFDGTPSKRVMILSPRDWAAHVQYEAIIAHALQLRGAEVTFVTCGGRLEICDRANVYEAPPMPCRTCAKYTRDSLEAHGFRVRALN